MVTAAKSIILSPVHYGHQLEGILEGAAKPGTCLMLKAATGPDRSGRLTYVPWNGAQDGEQDEVLILLEDEFQGKTMDDEIPTGSRIRMYRPLPGDELRVLAANLTATGSGTDDAFAVGDKLMIDDGTGKVVKTTGTPEMEPFKVIEAQTTITADTLLKVRYLGC